MQGGGYSPLFRRRNADGKLSKRRPVLPAYVTHQAEAWRDLVERAHHDLLRHFHRDVYLSAADSRAKARENRTETRQMRAKAKLVVLRRLIGHSYAKLGNRFEQYPGVATKCLVP